MALSRRDVERARSQINTSISPSALAARVQTNLDVVRDAYDTCAVALTELSKAFARIDSIAVQQGTPAAVKAFRDIAAAQRDIASTLIALRAEGRTTIRETLAAERPDAPPPQAPAADLGGTVPPPLQEFSSSREANPDLSDSPGIPNSDSEFANQESQSAIAIDSDSAPAANNHNHSELPLKKVGAPDGAPPLRPSPLGDFLRANKDPK
jgi:hypothetical protein